MKNMHRCRVIAALMVVAFSGGLLAQKKPNPVMQPIEDKPGLPRVLLIGDSISIGYTLAVREQLSGKANVHRPPTNCASTRTGVADIKKWLGDKPWDVIHFNFGLHDLKFVMGDTAQLVDLGTEASHRQVPLDEYRKNLEEIVSQLKKTGAKLIWCATTPVPAGAKGRYPEDAGRYNAVALKVMKKHEIVVNDLHAFAEPKLTDIQRSQNVHFSAGGSQILAKAVSEVILGQLETAQQQ